MNPQPQVPIFQIQQKLEASLVVIEFYETNIFQKYTLFMKTQKYPPNNIAISYIILYSLYCSMSSHIFLIALSSLNRSLNGNILCLSYYFYIKHTHEHVHIHTHTTTHTELVLLFCPDFQNHF